MKNLFCCIVAFQTQSTGNKDDRNVAAPETSGCRWLIFKRNLNRLLLSNVLLLLVDEVF